MKNILTAVLLLVTNVLFSQTQEQIDSLLLEEQMKFTVSDVSVKGTKQQIVYKLDKKVIDATASLLSAGGTAVNILENTPSIRIDADGEVSFRGSSGFKVYIDGKPSPFSGTQALQQIPSAQIQNIEIITTPSARYDTGSDVGIINVITKKNFSNGLSGIFNVKGGVDKSAAFDFLLFERRDKNRWFVGGNAAREIRESDFMQEKTTITNGVTTTSDANGPRKSNNYNYSFKSGYERIWERTDFGVDVEVGHGGRSRWGDLDYFETRNGGGYDNYQHNFNSRDKYNLYETYGSGNLKFNHNFKDEGHKIAATLYLKYGGGAMEYFESDLFDKSGQREQGHRAWEEEFRWTVKANLDYTLAYSSTGSIGLGYQYDSYSEDGDYKMKFYDPAINDFYWREDIYNTFYFQRGVNSIYAILNDSYKNFDFQAGLRGEHTHQVLQSSKEWANRIENRFEFFPSAHIGYTFSETNRLQAAYSRRTTRPELYFMEPYITFRDFYSAEIGNPDIRPEYINAYELSYRKGLGNNSLTVTGFHRSRTDKIERLRIAYSVPGVTLDSMANVGNDYSTGAELGSTVRTTQWWTITLNASMYHYLIKNKFSEGAARLSSTNYDVSLSNAFEIKKKTRVQFDANLVGPSVTTQGGTDAYFYANLAASHPIIKQRLQATLAFRNFLNTAKYVSTITQANLNSYTVINPRYPVISLTLSYNFNGYKSSDKQDKHGGDLFEGTNH